MPLVRGYSKDAFTKNLRSLRKEDYPPKQAIAIAYATARKALKARGLKETAARREDWKAAIKAGLASKGGVRRSPARPTSSKPTRGKRHREAAATKAKRRIGPYLMDVVYKLDARRSANEQIDRHDPIIERAAKPGKWWASGIGFKAGKPNERDIGFHYGSATSRKSAAEKIKKIKGSIPGLRTILGRA